MLHLEFQQNQQDPVQELTHARQNFNQIGSENKLIDHEQSELEGKNAKKTQIKQQSSSTKKFNKPFTIKENSEPLLAKGILDFLKTG